jgi:hypothetical protein
MLATIVVVVTSIEVLLVIGVLYQYSAHRR